MTTAQLHTARAIADEQREDDRRRYLALERRVGGQLAQLTAAARDELGEWFVGSGVWEFTRKLLTLSHNTLLEALEAREQLKQGAK
jgi:hypothetical protein